MKKLLIIAAASLVMASCGGLGEKQEHKLEHVDLTVTIPGKTKIECKDSNSFRKATCEYSIGKKRIDVLEIEESSFPTDVNMVEEAVKAGERFKSLTEKKTLPNGAFGVVYEEVGKKDKSKSFHEYLFYFKKGSRYYKITPILNSTNEHFPEIIESIGSLK